MSRRQKVFLALTVLWLAVIWGHSMMPAEDSGAESNFLAEWIMQYLPWMDDYVIRKVAHFAEYMVLGGLLYGAFPQRGRSAVTASVLAGVLIALIDETIQLFSPGRSGQIADVWLDMAGFCLSRLLLRLAIRKRQS